MTEQLPASTDEPLPGLAEPQHPGRVTELEAQVRRSLRYLVEHDLVDERHAGLMQLAVELSRKCGPHERAYGVAQVGAQLLATFDKLLPAVEGGGSDGGFGELRAYLAGVDAGGRPAQVRDPS